MLLAKKKRDTLFESDKISYVQTERIRPNPAQPRKIFNSDDIRELAESIRQYGILQPLTVRRRDGYFELVAGERRLRAARLVGMEEVPCIFLGIDREQSSFLALVENLQRKDLDFIEEAEGLARLILTFGLSQEEAARRIGKSQSAVANKLRILKHPAMVLEAIRAAALTERHARTLLRLPEERRLEAIEHIVQNAMNVAKTEEYVTDIIEGRLKTQGAEETPNLRQSTYIIKDVRFFINTVNRAVCLMRAAGVDADVGREESEEDIVLTIKIPKSAG